MLLLPSLHCAVSEAWRRRGDRGGRPWRPERRNGGAAVESFASERVPISESAPLSNDSATVRLICQHAGKLVALLFFPCSC
jgi:hypothetical protein